MKMEFLKSVMDSRGMILFCKYGNTSLNFVETKKGYSRGGHYHDFHSTHFLLKGKIIFKTFDLSLGCEQIKKFSAPCKIEVHSNIAHILTALTNSIFIEFFDGKYSSINYPNYRKLIEKQLKID